MARISEGARYDLNVSKAVKSNANKQTTFTCIFHIFMFCSCYAKKK